MQFSVDKGKHFVASWLNLTGFSVHSFILSDINLNTDQK